MYSHRALPPSLGSILMYSHRALPPSLPPYLLSLWAAVTVPITRAEQNYKQQQQQQQWDVWCGAATLRFTVLRLPPLRATPSRALCFMSPQGLCQSCSQDGYNPFNVQIYPTSVCRQPSFMEDAFHPITSYPDDWGCMPNGTVFPS